LVRSIFDNPPVGSCVLCGDSLCIEPEDDVNCPADCSSACGDRICDEGSENASKCPLDCASSCGDGICATGETPETCPNDCDFAIGDGQCEYGENPVNSPQDCTGAEACNHGGICDVTSCGDGFCQSFETSTRCPTDCCISVCDPSLVSRAVCLDKNVVQCVDGLGGGCPDFEVLEVCEQGCLNGACALCPQDGTNGGCEVICSSNEVRICLPHPTLPGCMIDHGYQSCSEFGGNYMCMPGIGCVQQCDQTTCNVGEARCLDNARIETCQYVPGNSCHQWVVTNVCVCDARSAPPTCLDL
jgi:hypothetical protein